MGTSASLSWSDPGFTLPTGPIQLFANDTKGASSTRRISIILCACDNGGTCIDAPDSPPYDTNGHYKQLCSCPQFFGGDSCEIEMRGCNYNVCPDYAVCVEDNTVSEGYTCSECSVGYELLVGMEKCIGKHCTKITAVLYHALSRICVTLFQSLL